MVKLPEEYKWSSYSYYINYRDYSDFSNYSKYIGIYDEEIIASNRILGYFNEKNKKALYKKFVEDAIASLIAEAE